MRKHIINEVYNSINKDRYIIVQLNSVPYWCHVDDCAYDTILEVFESLFDRLRENDNLIMACQCKGHTFAYWGKYQAYQHFKKHKRWHSQKMGIYEVKKITFK